MESMGAMETQKVRQAYINAVNDPCANLATSVGRPARDLGKGELIWKEIRSKLNLREGSRLLDIGCGYGEVTQCLLQDCGTLDIEVVLVDFPEIATKVREWVSEVKKIALYGGIYPHGMPAAFYKEDLFDFIILYSVIQYANDPEIFIKHALELLKPRGALLIGDLPNINKKGRFLASDFGREFEAEYRNIPKTEVPLYRTHEEYALESSGQNKKICDDFILETMISYRKQGFDVYVLPQAAGLPFGNTREDLLIVKK